MANKIAKRGISIYIDGRQVTNSLKDIKAEIRRLTNEQAKLPIGSAKYIEATKKITELKAILSEHVQYQKAIEKQYSKMGDAAGEYGKKKEDAFSFSKLTDGFNKYFGIITAGLAGLTGMTVALRKAVDDFAELEETEADVIKYTGMTRAEVKDLGEEFKKWDTRTARTELNALAADAGRLGKKSKKDILDFVEAGNIINVALGEDLGEDAIKNIGKLAMMFGNAEAMGLKEAMLATGSAINEVAQNSSAAEPYLVNFANRLAGVGNQSGMTISQILGLGSVLDQNAQQVEMSSTALSGLIMKLYKDPAKFAKIAGLEVSAFTKLLREDANEALLTLLETLGKKGGLADLAPIFEEMKLDGARASSVLTVLAANIEQIRKEQETANKAFSEGTSVINEANVKNNTLQATIDKAKKRFQELTYELGEKLAPHMSKFISSGGSMVKMLSSLTGFLIKHGSAVIWVTASFVSYYLAIKAYTLYQKVATTVMTVAKLATLANAGATAIATGNTIRASAAMKLYYATLANGTLGAKLYTAAIALMSAGKALLSRDIARATAAMRTFNTVVKLNLVGLAIAGVTALVTALILFTGKAKESVSAIKAVKEAEKEFNSELSKEQAYIKDLFNAYKKTNPESDEHRKIRDKIIEKYGPYLKGLIDEKGEITNIGKALQIVNDKLRQQITLKIRNAATEKLMDATVKNQTAIVDKMMEKVNKQVAGNETRNLIRKRINELVTELGEGENYTIDELNTRIHNTLTREFDVDVYKDGGLFKRNIDSYVSELSNEIKEGNKQIRAVKAQYAGLIDELTEVESLSPDGTGGDGTKPTPPPAPPAGDDKVSKQREALKDALEAIEKNHSEEMAKIKKQYLAGEIKTEYDYNQAVLAQQDTFDEERKKKINDLLKTVLTDKDVRIEAQKQIADIDQKTLDRQIEQAKKLKKLLLDADPVEAEKQAYENRLRELGLFDKKQEDMTDEQKEALELLEKQHQENLNKIDAKGVREKLKELDAAQAEEEAQIAERHRTGLLTEGAYQEELLKLRRNYLTKKLAIPGISSEQTNDLSKKLSENAADDSDRKAKERQSALETYNLIDPKEAQEAAYKVIEDFEKRGVLTHEEAAKAKAMIDQEYLDSLTGK
ncbi:MAG: phage tail tape measure protein, partial [Dysgonamonadaceae bacterium]|nr:phage tail tape measure protein [Dysgonamonadaceae bacterium]